MAYDAPARDYRGDVSWRVCAMGVAASLALHAVLLVAGMMLPTSRKAIERPTPIAVRLVSAPERKTQAPPRVSSQPPPGPVASRDAPRRALRAPATKFATAPAAASERTIAPSIPEESPAPIEAPSAPAATAPTTATAASGLSAPSSSSSSSSPVLPSAATPSPSPVTPPSFNAEYLSNPPPAYPSLSRRLGEQGAVMLRVYVTAQGLPQQIEVRSSSGYARLDEAASAAVRRWKFVPARHGDEPVDAWVLVPVTFSLRS